MLMSDASSVKTNHILPPIQTKKRPNKVKINKMSPSDRVFNLSPHVVKYR